ncbi:roadblock/LC7 domain-containing protein [Spirillospora sp. NPDC052242]
MTAPEHVHHPPSAPDDIASLVNDFVDETPGVSHAIIVSADGLALISSRSLAADLADSLSAMVAGLTGLCGSIAGHLDRGIYEHALLSLTHGHLLIMGISPLASMAVLTDTCADAGMVAHQMNCLVSRTGHLLTSNARDELRRRNGRRPA